MLGLLCLTDRARGFITFFGSGHNPPNSHHTKSSVHRQQTANNDDNDNPLTPQQQQTKNIETSAELPERFNYKVQALMGNFDPVGNDDERQEGNILNAMLTFPSRYTFTVVGKTILGGEEDKGSTQKGYVDQVLKIVHGNTGDEEVVCDVIPRGTKFVKVQCEASVQSVTMINTIYEELDKLERTVMRF